MGSALLEFLSPIVSSYNSYSARQDQRRFQEKIASEQKASNAADAAKERRQQIREERVRRARILQSAENTGVAGSAGELGAIGSLSTTLNSNLGFNLGALERAGNITDFNQGSVDAGLKAQRAQELGQLNYSIFQAQGGFGSFSSGK